MLRAMKHDQRRLSSPLGKGLIVWAAMLSLLAAVSLSWCISDAAAAARVALVIGNSKYLNAPELKNPRNDADALAAALSRLNFRVIKGIDADRFTMQTLVRAFSGELDGAKIAVFYYAGHGLQLNGKNYLIPVDAKLDTELDLDFEAMDVNFVLSQMERGNRINIVMLDACRNNPMSQKLARSMGTRSIALGRGLARIETGVGTLITFSTQPGNVALDGKGANSPFAKALLDNIEAPGLDIEVVMRRVREEVIKETGGRQVPWSNSSLVGDRVVLNSKPTAKVPVTAEPSPPAAEQKQRAPDNQLEITFWNTVRNSRNPALLKAYLQQYPNGNFVVLAQAMLAELTNEQQTSKPSSESVIPPSPELAIPQPEPTLAKPAIPLPRAKPQVNLNPQSVPAPPTLQPVPPPRKKVIVAPPTTKKKKKKAVRAPVLQKQPSAENCGFCYDCATMDCRQRRWRCGSRYQSMKQQGLCNRNH